MQERDKVIVVIINYRTSHLISNLLKSIIETRLNLKILVLDNESTAETYAELQNIKDARLEIIRSEKNLGFTGGINYTLKYALGKYAPFSYFFLFNPDAFSKPELIYQLKRGLDADARAACISPQIFHLDGTPWYSGAKVNAINGTVDNNPVLQTDPDSHGCHEVDVFSGCAGLFRMDRVMESGMFNEQLFMYYDEVEMSLRLKKLGYRILYNPTLGILHDVSYTTRKISHVKSYYMSRNKFAVFGSSMSTFNKVYFILHELAFYVKNGRFRNAVFHIKGLIDYKKGRYGALVAK